VNIYWCVRAPSVSARALSERLQRRLVSAGHVQLGAGADGLLLEPRRRRAEQPAVSRRGASPPAPRRPARLRLMSAACQFGGGWLQGWDARARGGTGYEFFGARYALGSRWGGGR
jgi:hypothetical protein